MQNPIAIAALAALASAFLFGVLTPGAMLLAPLILFAPAPLMIAGLGWHPLVAALGALFGAIVLSLGLGSRTGLSFALLIGLPSYLVCEAVTRLLSAMPADTPKDRAGRVFANYVLGGIALYAALAMLGGALAVSFDYAVYEGRLLALFQRMTTDLGRGSGQPMDPATAGRLAELMASVFVPLSAVIIASSLIVSLWLAIKALVRMKRISLPPLPAFSINFPKEILFWLVGALGFAQGPGFIGLFGACLAATILLLLMLNGLALIHIKTIGLAVRGMVLSAVWLSLFFFAPAALLYSLAGLLDALFNLRRTGEPPVTN